jgi:hypothetical protein
MARILPMAAMAAAAVYGIRFARREWQRVNGELDRLRGRDIPPAGTLRRDKISGEWRPSRCRPPGVLHQLSFRTQTRMSSSSTVHLRMLWVIWQVRISQPSFLIV